MKFNLDVIFTDTKELKELSKTEYKAIAIYRYLFSIFKPHLTR